MKSVFSTIKWIFLNLLGLVAGIVAVCIIELILGWIFYWLFPRFPILAGLLPYPTDYGSWADTTTALLTSIGGSFACAVVSGLCKDEDRVNFGPVLFAIFMVGMYIWHFIEQIMINGFSFMSTLQFLFLFGIVAFMTFSVAKSSNGN